MVHLDLTTDLSNFKALIYGTPTIVDLDGDGRSEVIIGTSLGLLYVLEGDTGTTKRFFPMQFYEIQAQVAVADIVGGPDLEMIVCDMGGNVVVVDVMGEVLWDIKLTGELPHTAIIGDVNGDGSLDVSVVAVSPDGSSHIWVLEGDTGLPLKGFPISLPTGAAISAPAILIDLHDYSQRTSAILSPMQYEDPALPPWARALRKSPIALSPSGKRKTSVATNSSTLMQSSGLHLLAPSFDGHLYIIDGVKGCAERIDIGDHIYSLPLIEDVDSDGYLDLLLTTLSGEALLFETTIPYHPLNAWASFPKGRMNGFTHGQQGISIPGMCSKRRIISYLSEFGFCPFLELEKRILKFTSVKGGSRLPLTFDIWDARRLSSDASSPRKYTVKITRGLHKAAPLVSESFDRPGRYTIFVPVSPPESMVLIIGMTNEHGQYFEDSASVSISTRFYIWIKYLLVAPFLLLTIPILLSSKLKTL